MERQKCLLKHFHITIFEFYDHLGLKNLKANTTDKVIAFDELYLQWAKSCMLD